MVIYMMPIGASGVLCDALVCAVTEMLCTCRLLMLTTVSAILVCRDASATSAAVAAAARGGVGGGCPQMQLKSFICSAFAPRPLLMPECHQATEASHRKILVANPQGATVCCVFCDKCCFMHDEAPGSRSTKVAAAYVYRHVF